MIETPTRNEWHPQPGKQTEALRYRVFELLYGGARGGGKSEGGRAWMTIDIEHPLLRGLVIRKNASDLKDWVDKAKQLYSGMGASYVDGEFRFPSGAKIYTGHLKDDSSYEKYQGTEIHRLNVEELTQIPDEERYLRLLSSVRSTVPGLKARVFTTANPGGPGHGWVKARFIDDKEPMKVYYDPVSGRGRVFIPATIDDNPILMKNDPDYAKFLESLPENLMKAWRYGDWNVFAGQYFSEWDESVHVVTPFTIPASWRRFGAYDHGRANPACFHWYAVDWDGNVYVYRELYVNKKDNSVRWEAEDIAKEVAKITREAGEHLEYVVVDSAIFSQTGTAETIAQILQKNGVGKIGTCIPLILPSHKDRIAGWTILHQMLKHEKDRLPRLRYFKTCVDAIRTIPSLIHDDRKPEDLDSDGEDHAADTDRYFLQTLFDKKTPETPSPFQQAESRFKEKLGLRAQDPTRPNRFNV